MIFSLTSLVQDPEEQVEVQLKYTAMIDVVALL